MGLFKDLVLNDLEFGLSNTTTGIEYPFPELSRYANYIRPGEFIAVGGRPMSGKRTFIDFTYVLSVYKQWLAMENKKPLKIFYFGIKSASLKMTLKRWLCTHLMMKHGMVIDTNTLDPNSLGKMYDLRETAFQDNVQYIMDTEEYFDEMLEDTVQFIPGAQTPAGIFSTVRDYMLTIGEAHENPNKLGMTYELDAEHEGQLTIVIVDDANRLTTDIHNFAPMNKDELQSVFCQYMNQLAKTYTCTPVVGVPSKTSMSRNPKDSEPSYKELGIYASTTTKAFIMYYPFNEGQSTYANKKVSDYNIGETNKLRSIYLARNETGISNIEMLVIMLEGSGWFTKIPSDEIKATSQRAKLIDSAKVLGF